MLGLFCLFLLVVDARVHIPMHRKLKPIVRDENNQAYIRNPKHVLSRLGRRSELSPRQSGKSFPLRGNWTALALWYMIVEFGSQAFHVQVDTGSSDLAVPDQSCNCGQHQDQPWNPTQAPGVSPAQCNDQNINCNGQSTSCNNSQCEYSISYGDGSGYSALVYTTPATFGSFALGGIPIASQYAGSIVSETGNFEPPAADGIMGFAQQSLSVIGAMPMIQAISENDSSCPFIFSMCGDVHHLGGLLTVCGEGQHHYGDYQWTPMINYDQGFYNVHIVDMAVGGTRLNISPTTWNTGMSTVDSGTTLMLLPDDGFAAMKAVFLANCSSNNLHGICDVSSSETLFDNGSCFSFTQEQLAAFPDLQIIFGQSDQITVTINPNAYLVPGFCSDTTQYSLSLQPIGGTGTLMGDTIMLANEVTYDVENKRMGFAPKDTTCVFQFDKK